MTHTARTVLPTDLVALVSYDGRVYANEAMTLDRIGTNDSPHPLETAFEQWFSFATGRHTWISVKGPTLRGLVSARKRGSKLAWEIDCLINASEADNSVVMSLLDQVTAAAGKSGAFKIFVRLPASSPSLPCASRAGFTPYLHEQVYCRSTNAAVVHSANSGLRRRTKADLYGIFQLYNGVVPHEVRRTEAMTYAEWMGTQESLGKAAQYVLERDGRIQGWLRIARDGDLARFDLLAEPAALDDLIEAALAKTTGVTVCALLPDYQESTRARLAALGFEPGNEYAVLARKTVRPVKSPRSVPALAHTALG
jgi:hypothetical protein